MNLHEECLLKYLLNPLDLLRSTELLKINNNLLEKCSLNKPVLESTKSVISHIM